MHLCLSLCQEKELAQSSQVQLNDENPQAVDYSLSPSAR